MLLRIKIPLLPLLSSTRHRFKERTMMENISHCGCWGESSSSGGCCCGGGWGYCRRNGITWFKACRIGPKVFWSWTMKAWFISWSCPITWLEIVCLYCSIWSFSEVFIIAWTCSIVSPRAIIREDLTIMEKQQR